MFQLRRQYPGKQNAKRLAQLVVSILIGVVTTFLLGFVLTPRTAAVHPDGSPLQAWDSPVITPVPNTHTAPATTTVSVTYDEDIDPATVSTRTFAVHAMQTGLLTQTYGVDGGTISLTPPRPFRPGELVQTSATTGTLNLSGQGPATPTVWQFWTAVTGGSGVFTDSGQSLGISNTYGVALGDLDGDGGLDAFVANWGPNEVWLNDGTGDFDDSGQRLGNSDSWDVALGDLNGDGYLDVFVANGTLSNTLWLNDGTGSFGDSRQIPSSLHSCAVALGDLDGDADLDAFVANWGANEVWLNDGTGHLDDSGQRLGNADSWDVALGDLNGDGYLDVFVANGTLSNTVWLNDGAGDFGDGPHQYLGGSYSWAAALGDLDDNGHLDAFVANWGPNEVWLNDETGHLDDSGQRLDNSSSQAVALGDVDGDGDLDAFVANVGANKVWLNDGGNFVDSHQRLGSSATVDVGLPRLQRPFRAPGYARPDSSVSSGVALGDVNGNGALDAFVANSGSQANKVWLNMVPAIDLEKTVGPDAHICADADSIGVTPNSRVFYCYRVTNVGGVTLTTHTLVDSELGVILSDHEHNLVPGVTWFITREATIAETTVNTAVWTALAHDYAAVAKDTAAVGVVIPEVRIDHIIPNPSCFLEPVQFNGVGVPDTIGRFLEYEWTRIPETETCGSYLAPTLLGTAARIEDNTLPVGEHRICLRGGVYTNTTPSGSYTMVWSPYDTTTMTVRGDRWAYSDIAVGPKSVSFWADPSAEEYQVHHPDVGDTVYVKIQVHNISVQDTPDETTVFFYDGPITASLHGPVEGTLVGTDTIAFIAERTSEFVTIPWTIGGEVGYRPFAVDIEYTDNISYFSHLPLPPYDEPHFESDYRNNRTISAVPAGRITGTYAISVTGKVDPIRQPRLYAGYPAHVHGQANYAWDVLLATMGATTTIEISGLCGGVPYRETYQTWTTSPSGEYWATIQLPPEPGDYVASVVVDDGNLVGALTGAQAVGFTVLEPPEPLPDLYVERFSVLLYGPDSGPNTYIRHWQDYTLHRVYNRSMLFGIQNEPVTITAQVRNGGNLAVTDTFVVSFYNGTPEDGGTLIGTETIEGLRAGARQVVRHVWTPAQTGVYTIQVMVDGANAIREANEINNYDRYYYRYQLCFNRIVGSCHHAAHRDVVDVRAAGPDLQALGLKYVEPAIGEVVTMKLEVHNIGHDDVLEGEAFTLTVYDGYPHIGLLSTRVLTAPVELRPQRVEGPMNRGTYQIVDVVWDTGYTGTVPGWHHICAEVDSGAEIDEELEENNVKCWDLYVFPDEADLYPYKLTYSNDRPLPNEPIGITAWFENRGAESFPSPEVSTAVVTFYHRSIAPENWITTTVPVTIPGPIEARRGKGSTLPITWTTYDAHGTAYIYVEYIKESGYNRGPHNYVQRLNILKKPSPNLRILSRDIHVDPRMPRSGDPVNVTVGIANVSRSLIATATNFLVEFHTSGPTAGYHELGQPQTIPSLGPGEKITVTPSTTFTMADKFYAVQVSAWPRIEQGDVSYRDNEATTTLVRWDVAMPFLAVTVGTEPGVCAATDSITVLAGTPVFYCYQMTNPGDVRLGVHDLFDDQLGNVLSGYTYDLLPGETLTRIEAALPTETAVSTATWVASTDPYVFVATDAVRVVRLIGIYLPVVLKDTG